MTPYIGARDYVHGQGEKLGVLLINLGSPAAPTPTALRTYLRQFLSDTRVIETPRFLWWFLLNFIIVPRRAPRSAAVYKKIWTAAGSPLLVYSHSQQKRLAVKLKTMGLPALVELGMNYGEPSIPDALHLLKKQGMSKLLVLPLYPQYASSTIGSVFETVTGELRRWRWVPHLRMIHSYCDDPAFIKELANSVRAFQRQYGKPELLLFSFHGIPLASLLDGDPYHCQCHKTARLVVERLGLKQHEYRVCFQSRFGKQEWLQPYTDKTLLSLPTEGIHKVQVICPGFSADCLETMEEIDQENRHYFLNAGGREFHYIPCLNDAAGHINFLAQLVKRTTVDWHAQLLASNEEKNKERSRALAQQLLTNAGSYKHS